MPDENKLRALNLAGYRIRLTCGNCDYLKRKRVDGPEWGTCAKITYDHGKHTERRRCASVHVSGWCGQHRVCTARTERLGQHSRFLLEVPGLDGPARNLERFWAKAGHAVKLHLFGPDIFLGEHSACSGWGTSATEGKPRFYAPTRDEVCKACLRKSPKALARIRRAENE